MKWNEEWVRNDDQRERIATAHPLLFGEINNWNVCLWVRVWAVGVRSSAFVCNYYYTMHVWVCCVSVIAKCHNFRFDYLFIYVANTHKHSFEMSKPKSNIFENIIEHKHTFTSSKQYSSHLHIFSSHSFTLARAKITIFGKYRFGLFVSCTHINNFLCFHNLISTFSIATILPLRSFFLLCLDANFLGKYLELHSINLKCMLHSFVLLLSKRDKRK